MVFLASRNARLLRGVRRGIELREPYDNAPDDQQLRRERRDLRALQRLRPGKGTDERFTFLFSSCVLTIIFCLSARVVR